METKKNLTEKVLELHKENPELTAGEIAEVLGTSYRYVKTVGYRYGLTFPTNMVTRMKLAKAINEKSSLAERLDWIEKRLARLEQRNQTG